MVDFIRLPYAENMPRITDQRAFKSNERKIDACNAQTNMSLTQRKRLHTDSAGTKPPFVVVVRPENHVVSCQDFDPASRYRRTKATCDYEQQCNSRKKKMVKSGSRKRAQKMAS